LDTSVLVDGIDKVLFGFALHGHDVKVVDDRLEDSVCESQIGDADLWVIANVLV
jgi:hypothetical protein